MVISIFSTWWSRSHSTPHQQKAVKYKNRFLLSCTTHVSGGFRSATLDLGCASLGARLARSIRIFLLNKHKVEIKLLELGALLESCAAAQSVSVFFHRTKSEKPSLKK